MKTPTDLPLTKKALVIKCFTGLYDALMGSDRTGWDVTVFQDFKDAETLDHASYHDAIEVALRVIQSNHYDLIVVEEPTFFTTMQELFPVEVAPHRHKFLVGDKEARRLETDRTHGKFISQLHGIPATKSWHETVSRDSDMSMLKFIYRNHEKIVIKRNHGQMITIGTPDAAFEELGLMLKTEKGQLEITVEPYVNLKNAIEFSVCGFANGKEFEPICTLFDFENRLFPGNMGPKISDVSQVIFSNVSRKCREFVKGLNAWVAKTGYRGWLDVDAFYDRSTREMKCFEYLVRFGIPSMAAIIKLYNVNWLDAMYAALNGESTEQFNWSSNKNGAMAMAIGMFSFSTEFNSMSGRIPTGATVTGWKPFRRQNSILSRNHLVSIETVCDGKKMQLAGTKGRHFVAIGVGNHWKPTLLRAYAVADAVDYPNKVYKRNLFGLENPSTADFDFEAALPVLQSTFL